MHTVSIVGPRAPSYSIAQEMYQPGRGLCPLGYG
jgi:hypothetical protein